MEEINWYCKKIGKKFDEFDEFDKYITDVLKDFVKDKQGKEINVGDLFEFDFWEEIHSKIKLKGSFSFNDDDLAYEIDVINNERYVCLTFATCVNLISNIRRI